MSATLPTALVIGEALVDIIVDGDSTTEHPGGSPANVACGLALLGMPTAFLTRIGDDDRGRAVQEHLAAAGVSLLAASVVDAPTSTAMAVLDEAGNARYEFDLYWDVPVIPTGRVSAVHTGSIAAFLEPGASRVRDLLAAVGDTALVTFDPNIRPALLTDHAAALGAFETLAALAGVVKLSDDDARWLYPGRDDGDVLAHVLTLGPRLAVMTKGAAGSQLRTADHAVELPAAPVTVVDTVGAGDSYMAALIFGLLGFEAPLADADSLTHLGRFAASAAAVTVSRQGARLPRLEELASR